MRVGVVAGLMAVGTVMGGAPAEAQQAGLPALSAQGIARAAILCLVVDDTPARLELQRRLCEQVRAIAASGAPVPVEAIGFGDPALLGRDTLGVLVHAAYDRARNQVVLSIRPHRNAPSASTLFGATPVAVTPGPDGAIPEAALAAALDQVLPWRMRAAG